jgi:hypothetical protein
MKININVLPLLMENGDVFVMLRVLERIFVQFVHQCTFLLIRCGGEGQRGGIQKSVHCVHKQSCSVSVCWRGLGSVESNGEDAWQDDVHLYSMYTNTPVLELCGGEVVVLRVMERMLGKMMSICTVCTQTHLCWSCVEEKCWWC